MNYGPNGANGYLARGVGAMLTQKFEGQDIQDPDEMLSASREHILLLRRRGMSEEACRLVFSMRYERARRIQSRRNDKKPFLVPRNIVDQLLSRGGWGCRNPFTRVTKIEDTSKQCPTVKIDLSGVQTNMEMFATRDRVTMISEQLCLPWRVKTYLGVKRAETIISGLPSEMRSQALEQLKQDYIAHLGVPEEKKKVRLGDTCPIIKEYDEISSRLDVVTKTQRTCRTYATKNFTASRLNEILASHTIQIAGFVTHADLFEFKRNRGYGKQVTNNGKNSDLQYNMMTNPRCDELIRLMT